MISISETDHCLNRTYSTDEDIEDNHHNFGLANSGEVELESIQYDNENGTDGNHADIMESNVIHNIDSRDPALWRMKLHAKDIVRIISNGPCDIPNRIFPLDEHKRHFSKSYQIRNIDNGEQLTRRWLVYSQSADRAFSFCCRIFDRNPISALSISGYNNWKHMSDILKQKNMNVPRIIIHHTVGGSKLSQDSN